MENLSKKTILITGCSTGIGLCIANGLKNKGYRVYASARKQIDVAELRSQGHTALQLDLRDSGSITQAVAEVVDATNGRIYGLVNNGAYGQPGAVEDLSRQALTEQFETNVFGTHELTTLMIPHMRRQKEGRIVQISSILGLICLPFRGAYNASKYALEGLSDTLRLELAGTGIHVSLIEPGPIDSAFRPNAFKAFQKHIDSDASPFRDLYTGVEARLTSEESVRFMLPPEAVLKKVIHALESSRPCVRYPVTVPTHVLGRLKRILPDRVMDRILGGSMDK